MAKTIAKHDTLILLSISAVPDTHEQQTGGSTTPIVTALASVNTFISSKFRVSKNSLSVNNAFPKSLFQEYGTLSLLYQVIQRRCKP